MSYRASLVAPQMNEIDVEPLSRRCIAIFFLLDQGDEVCRAVWMQDTGARTYPRPKRANSGTPGAAAGATSDKANTQDDDGREIEEEEEEEEGPVGLVPYPLRAAAILEDAYQFLAWHLECGRAAVNRGTGSSGAGSEGGATGKASRGRKGGPSSSSPTVLLTVQVRRVYSCTRFSPSSATGYCTSFRLHDTLPKERVNMWWCFACHSGSSSGSMSCGTTI